MGLLDAYNNYIYSEFNDEPLNKLTENLGLMYTTYEDKEIEIHYNTITKQFIGTINGITRYIENADFEKATDFIERCYFDGYYSIMVELCDKEV